MKQFRRPGDLEKPCVFGQLKYQAFETPAMRVQVPFGVVLCSPVGQLVCLPPVSIIGPGKPHRVSGQIGI